MKYLFPFCAVVLGVAAASAQRLPSTVMVQNQQWIITYFQAGDTRTGETTCEDHGIQVRKNLSLATEQETLMHELLHAEACDKGGDLYYNSEGVFGPSSHTGLEHISTATMDLLQHNPELLQYFEPAPSAAKTVGNE